MVSFCVELTRGTLALAVNPKSGSSGACFQQAEVVVPSDVLENVGSVPQVVYQLQKRIEASKRGAGLRT